MYDPYSDSVIVDLGDGDILVERTPAQPATISNPKAIHTVLEGETLQSIAFQYYGDSGYWPAIADVNSIYNPFTDLKPNMQIYIP
jgi:nucleoid-associated protein YgaU